MKYFLIHFFHDEAFRKEEEAEEYGEGEEEEEEEEGCHLPDTSFNKDWGNLSN